MRPIIRRLAALAALSVFALGVARAEPAGKSIQWQTNFKKAQALAARQNKIMMVDFYADW